MTLDSTWNKYIDDKSLYCFRVIDFLRLFATVAMLLIASFLSVVLVDVFFGELPDEYFYLEFFVMAFPVLVVLLVGMKVSTVEEKIRLGGDGFVSFRHGSIDFKDVSQYYLSPGRWGADVVILWASGKKIIFSNFLYDEKEFVRFCSDFLEAVNEFNKLNGGDGECHKIKNARLFAKPLMQVVLFIVTTLAFFCLFFNPYRVAMGLPVLVMAWVAYWRDTDFDGD